MALSKEVYQALEDIVSPENISQEPATLDSYRMGDRGGFALRPEAVLLPGSAEEVQAIVKACNRYRIKFRSSSSGLSGFGAPTEGVINLDLRRMNRILEIDEKNMFAVVEPYVIFVQLQAEAMKLGLNTHTSGAGGSCSILAVAAGGGGYGPDTLYQGHGSETLLGLEWVMPNGDILRTGSLSSRVGWFCGEGPGPSLRGLARGKIGLGGGLGVFTRCAVKLSPWPGPAVMPIEGTVPAYNTPLPENIRAYTLVLPSWQAYADIHYEIYDAEIGYIAHRQFPMMGEDLSPAFFAMFTDPTKSFDDLGEIVNKPEIQKLIDELRYYSFQFILAGMTPRDIEYQEKVLDQILADTGGHKVAAWSKPTMERFTLLYLLRLPFKMINNTYAGGRGAIFTPHGTPDLMIQYAPVILETMSKHQEKGLLVQCGADMMMGPVSSLGGGGCTHFEGAWYYERTDIESAKASAAAREAMVEASVEVGMPQALGGANGQPLVKEGLSKVERQADLAARPQPARFHWQWKIKQMLDPNDAGESQTYPALEKPPKDEGL